MNCRLSLTPSISFVRCGVLAIALLLPGLAQASMYDQPVPKKVFKNEEMIWLLSNIESMEKLDLDLCTYYISDADFQVILQALHSKRNTEKYIKIYLHDNSLKYYEFSIQYLLLAGGSLKAYLFPDKGDGKEVELKFSSPGLQVSDLIKPYFSKNKTRRGCTLF